jgi:nicotinamide mononucleotide adenylyltransferase
VLLEGAKDITVLLPGGFKPPHAGHLHLAKAYAALPEVKEVQILIGPTPRDGFTREDSIAIWDELLRGTKKIKVVPIKTDNPIRAAYEYVETAQPGGYALAASSKGKDYERVKTFTDQHQPGGKYHSKLAPGVQVVLLPADPSPLNYNKRDDGNTGGISASTLRKDVAEKNTQNIVSNYPGIPLDSQKRIVSILTNKVMESKKKSKRNAGLTEGQPEQLEERMKILIKNVVSKMVHGAFGPITNAKMREEIKDAVKVAIEPILKKYDYVVESNSKKPIALNEGGAAGHLVHPYEDMELSFDDIKNIVDLTLSGKVEYAQEKLDGQNIMVTYKDGELRAARNKTHLKNKGEQSLSVEDVRKMFDGRGPIQTAFVESMNDLQAAIGKLTPQQKEDFFEDGKRFISLEVLYPDTANVVPYGVTQLRLHHFKEYDDAGNVVDEDTDGIRALQTALDQYKATQQKTFQVRATDLATIKQDSDYANQRRYFDEMVNSIQGEYNLKNNQTIGDYNRSWWGDFIKDKAKEYNYAISKDVLSNLIARWADSDKSLNIRNLVAKIDNPEFSSWVQSFDKSDYSTAKKKALEPVETLFLQLGVRVLKNLEGLIAANPDASVRKIKQDVANSIRDIKQAAETGQLQSKKNPLAFLKQQLKRLEDIGGFDAIMPTEGVVFKHGGKLYKLTGAFAPINQILGYMKF